MALMLILAALAVYRLATDLAWMDGPFEGYARARGWALAHGPGWIGEGATCPICLSFWLALPAGLLLSFDAMGLVYWLAIAGAVALFVRITHHD